MNKEYQLIVKTNSYAGNFEREMCAFMTGQVGQEDNTGQEYVTSDIKDLYEDIVGGKSDEHGCSRPVDLDEDTNNFIIFLERLLTKEEMEHMSDRAKLWEELRPYEYLDKDFKFLGLEQVEVTINKKRL